jgi:hypothetical protein
VGQRTPWCPALISLFIAVCLSSKPTGNDVSISFTGCLSAGLAPVSWIECFSYPTMIHESHEIISGRSSDRNKFKPLLVNVSTGAPDLKTARRFSAVQ